MTGRDDYQERQDARRARLETASAKRAAEGEAKLGAARRTLDAIPLGQPILVGHHSEKRHRRDIARTQAQMSAGFKAQAEAADLARRADAVGSAGISADDPEAVVKLREELAGLEIERERMKAANAAWRKATPEARATMKRFDRLYDAAYPPYKLTNLGANIRRIEARIAALSAPTPTFEPLAGDGWRIEARPDLNRITLTSATRLPRETFLALKRDGWRWSPTEGAFLVGLHNRGIYAARAAASRLAPAAPTGAEINDMEAEAEEMLP